MQGKVLLEWDSKKGKAPVPLLKDVFGMERRRAKVLNFSIAYGKTAMGLAKDWNVEESIKEIERGLELELGLGKVMTGLGLGTKALSSMIWFRTQRLHWQELGGGVYSGFLRFGRRRSSGTPLTRSR